MSTLSVTDADFDRLVVEAGGVVLVDYWAPWCGPCRALAPILEDLADDFEGRARVAKIDADANPAAAARFGVSALPTLVLFKDGQEQERLVGAQTRSRLNRLLEQAL